MPLLTLGALTTATRVWEPLRLELPIDHYRLLGVSPAPRLQPPVLRTLQHRPGSPHPKQGFSHESAAEQGRPCSAPAPTCLPRTKIGASAYEAQSDCLRGSGGDALPDLTC